MMTIRETERNYTLQFPYDPILNQKAMSITGFWWNAKDRLWQYPKNDMMLMIIMEQLQPDNISETVSKRVEGLKAFKERLVEAEDIKKAETVMELEKFAGRFKTVPYQHQLKAWYIAKDLPYYGFLFEMGAGKTKAVIDTVIEKSRAVKYDRGYPTVLIVCPKALLQTWKQEILTHTTDTEKDINIMWAQSASKKARLIAHTSKWNIINYDNIASQLTPLIQHGFDFAILDESQRIKTPGAQVTKAAMKLAVTCKHRYILTGTPVSQSPFDLYSQMRFLDPAILGASTFTVFKVRYADFGGYGGYEVKHYKNLDHLQSLIAPYSYRVLKKDCLDLPDKIYKVIPFDLSTQEMEYYQKMKEECLIELARTQQTISTMNTLSSLTKLRQITSGFILDAVKMTHILSRDKPTKLKILQDLLEFNKTLSGEYIEKYVIWCVFRSEIEQIIVMLKENFPEIKYVTVRGGQDNNKENCDLFNTDPKINVCIAQIQAGGVGLSMIGAQSGAVIYYNNTFSLSDRLQSEDRSHRIGTKQNVVYYDLVAKGTIAVSVAQALKRKINVAEFINREPYQLANFLSGREQE